jgi:hypothetical protein
MQDQAQRAVLVVDQRRHRPATHERASASASRSMQVMAVRGSLIPGDRARSAISTSASIENSRSWGRRALPPQDHLVGGGFDHLLAHAWGRPGADQRR